MAFPTTDPGIDGGSSGSPLLDNLGMGPLLSQLLQNHSDHVAMLAPILKAAAASATPAKDPTPAMTPPSGAPLGSAPAMQPGINPPPKGLSGGSMGPIPPSMLGMGSPNLSMPSATNDAAAPGFDPWSASQSAYQDASGQMKHGYDLRNQAAAIPNPTLGAPVNKHNLWPLMIGALASLLGGKSARGALGSYTQGFLGTANQEQQRELENAQTNAANQRNPLLSQSDQALQQGQAGMARAGSILQRGIDQEKLNQSWKEKLLAAQTELDKTKLLVGGRSDTASLTQAFKDASNPESQARPGAMRVINQHMLAQGLPAPFTDDDLAKAAALSTKQQLDVSKSGLADSQAKHQDALTLTENDLRSHKVDDLIAQGHWKEAEALAQKADSELTRVKAQWLPKTSQADISYKGALSDAARKNANANLFKAMNDPKGATASAFDSVDKLDMDLQGKIADKNSLLQSLVSRYSQMDPEDPKRAQVEKDMDTTKAALLGVNHKFAMLQKARDRVATNLGLPPKPTGKSDAEIKADADAALKAPNADKQKILATLKYWRLN